MKKILLLASLVCCTMAFAQQQLNNYKYVIVPEQYEFLNKKDEYSLNTLTKMALEKVGFTVFLGSNLQLPQEVALDRCRALYADVERESNILSTELTIVLKDCNGQVVYKTASGKSKEKEHRKSYLEALREASRSLNQINYNYSGNTTIALQGTKANPANTPAAQPKQVNNTNLLTANPTSYGYELLDKEGKLVLKMYKTTQADYYSAKMETLNGVIFLKDGQWIFEYYDRDDKLISEKLNIKF